MVAFTQPKKHQDIINSRVLPEIRNIFPNEAECVIDPWNEYESVNVKYKIRLSDDPTKAPEIKYERVIVRFSIDLIDDWLDNENEYATRNFQSVLKRIYDYIKNEYEKIQKGINHNDGKSHVLLINSNTLNLKGFGQV